jgi:uncharacterized FlaG/YvyC family protein
MDIKSIRPIIIDKILSATVRDTLVEPHTTARMIETRLAHGFKFEVDKETGETIVKVLDHSGKIIRVIPLEHLVDISGLEDSMGSIVDKTL